MDDFRLWFVMPFIKGGELSKVLKKWPDENDNKKVHVLTEEETMFYAA